MENQFHKLTLFYGSRMKKIFKYLVLSLLFTSTHSFAEKGQVTLTNKQVADAIQTTFEQNLFQLPPRVQGHYGIRLYRTTKDEKYLPAALYDYYFVADRMHTISNQIFHKGYVLARSKELIANLSKGKRGKARRASIKKFPTFIFYADEVLRYSARLDEFGVEIPPIFINAIKSYDFLPVLKDKEMIRAWAAQLANYVYWLRQLGIADYTAQYQAAFFDAYPHEEDDEMSKWHFKNKLYGLTHIVFADSQYYQHKVSSDELGWILNYFDRNEERIFNVASDDIIAEIGICYEIMDQHYRPMVAKTKAHLVNSFNPDAGMIPSVSGRIDLSTGEHRNVLALMLLNWPEKLNQGPYFKDIEAVKKYLPTNDLKP